MLSGAAASIVLAAPLYTVAVPLGERLERRLASRAARATAEGTEAAGVDPPDDRRRHVVVCGYGRVGRLIAGTLERRGFRHIVIEDDPRAVAELRARGVTAIRGSADNRVVLEQAHLERAAALVVAVPDPVAARLIVRAAREAHPRLPIVARTNSTAERTALRELGAEEVVVGELELGLEMTRFTLRKLGVSSAEANAIVAGLRDR
jgi:CPA2 family monovalent cation:H+ antiporter-2